MVIADIALGCRSGFAVGESGNCYAWGLLPMPPKSPVFQSWGGRGGKKGKGASSHPTPAQSGPPVSTVVTPVLLE